MARYELRPVGVFDRETGRDVRPSDPGWIEYQAALSRGEMPDPQPADPPAPDARFDPVLAGRARETRQLARLAERQPLEAALVASGLKRRNAR